MQNLDIQAGTKLEYFSLKLSEFIFGKLCKLMLKFNTRNIDFGWTDNKTVNTGNTLPQNQK